jgi:hypothetical protein
MKKSHKIYAILNAIILIAVIFWNYWTNVNGINGNTVSSLSRDYQTLFTPASYAFSIWGIIYLALTAQAIFFIKRAFSPNKDSSFLSQIGPYLIMTNILNSAWLWFWLMNHTGSSVIVMFMIMTSLIILILNLNMERWDAPAKIIFGVWWPIAIYSGWITVATIANVSAYLTKIEWTGPFSEFTWVVIMISVATLINLFMIWTRNLREFSLVGIWALVAIAVRHWDSYPDIKTAALAGAGIVFIAVTYHGYQNRKINPFSPSK